MCDQAEWSCWGSTSQLESTFYHHIPIRRGIWIQESASGRKDVQSSLTMCRSHHRKRNFEHEGILSFMRMPPSEPFGTLRDPLVVLPVTRGPEALAVLLFGPWYTATSIDHSVTSTFSVIFATREPFLDSRPGATTMATSGPTIVLIPGAFHVDSAMDALGAELQRDGYNTRSWGLVTVNHAGRKVDADVRAMLDELLHPLILNEGKDIVLYFHSCAGFPGSAAIQGLSKKERTAKGQSGGIVGLIYQSAFVPKLGDTLLQNIGGSYAPWQAPDVCLITCPQTRSKR